MTETVVFLNDQNMITKSYGEPEADNVITANVEIVGVNNSIFVGNSTVNTNINATSYSISNSTVSFTINSPTEEEQSSGLYYLNANGVWSIIQSTGGTGGDQITISAGNGIKVDPLFNIRKISVVANSGIVANSLGLFVNNSYIATLSVNNATNFAGLPSSSYVSNTYLNSNFPNNTILDFKLSEYVKTSDLGSGGGEASGTAYNTLYVGTVEAANVVSNAQLRANIAVANTSMVANAAAAYSNSVTYTDGKISTANTAMAANADAAYSNSVTYTDGKITTANSAMAANADAAYSNSVTYTDGKITTANSAMAANADAAYSNSVTYTDGKISTANTAMAANADAAYSNAVSYTDGKITTANTSMVANADAAYSNAVSYTDGKISTANTAMAANAAAAYSNAVSYVNSILTDGVNVGNNIAVSGNISFSNPTYLHFKYGSLYSNTLTTSSTTADQILDQFPRSVYRSANYMISITSGTSYQTTQISVISDGLNAYISEYGTISTSGDLATFSATIISADVVLQTTPTNAVTTYKFIRTSINV